MPRPENPHKRGYRGEYFGNKRAILARKPMCYKCRVRRASEVDHVVPLVNGGSNNRSNLRPICAPCNRKSGGGVRRTRKSVMVAARVQAALIKASFGGDRSAAGRYAAEQRWKGHVKQESLQLGQRPSWMPVKVYERLKKISEATEKARSLGVTTSVRLATEMTAEEIADLRNEIKEMRGENQAETAQKVISEIGKERYKRWSEALRVSSLALGMLEEQPKLDPDNYVTEGMSSEQRFTTYMNQPPRFSQTEYLVVSRDANGKLAGLAFVGVEDKEQKTPSYPIKWFGDTGRTLHIHQFASFQNVPDMGSALFGEVLKAAQGKGVWRVRLEATALSKNYWEKQGFKADYKDALGMEYLIGVDEAASSNMLKASFGGDRSAAGRYAAEQRWKGHVKEDEKGGRSTDAKLAEGPSNLLYGRDEFGMPKMGSLPELKKRYGSSAEKRSQYFRLVYGLRVTVEPVRAGSPEEATQLGGLQALEELCMSINDVPKLVRKVTLEPQVERYDGRAAGVHGQYSSGYVDLATRETAKFATETIQNIAAIQRIMLERGVVGEAEAATSGVLASRRDNVSDIFASAEAARTKPSPSPETSPTDIKRASQRAGYAVMIHEFGHAIDFGRNGELSDLGGGQTRDTALSTQQADRLAELQSPSRYGTMNQYEKVAESWASWWLFGGASESNSPAWATRIRSQGVQILGPILEERKDVVKSEELSLRLLDLPVTHPVTMFIVAPFISSAALIKASFGGDRSAAGRYAANIRWQNANAERNEAWQRGREALARYRKLNPEPTDGSLKTHPVRNDAPDISQELKTYFGETQDAHLVSQGYRDIQKKVADDGRYHRDVGNTMLETIAEKQGFTGRPRVVSAEEMAQLEKDGWTIVFRGIQDTEADSPSTAGQRQKLVSAEELAEQFRTGQYFAGFGNAGSGIYFAEDELIAQYYAGNARKEGFGQAEKLTMGDKKRGAVLKVAIPPGALMSEAEFREEISKHRDEGGKGAFFGSHDLGVKLAARGVRGVKNTMGGFSADGYQVVVLWDRSMVAVQEAETQE